MIIEGVQCTDGTPLDLPIEERKLLGYQIEHKKTGRLLPSTTNFQVYKRIAAVTKMIEVAEVYKINVEDYILSEIYHNDIEVQCTMIAHPLDLLFGE